MFSYSFLADFLEVPKAAKTRGKRKYGKHENTAFERAVSNNDPANPAASDEAIVCLNNDLSVHVSLTKGMVSGLVWMWTFKK